MDLKESGWRTVGVTGWSATGVATSLQPVSFYTSTLDLLQINSIRSSKAFSFFLNVFFARALNVLCARINILLVNEHRTWRCAEFDVTCHPCFCCCRRCCCDDLVCNCVIGSDSPRLEARVLSPSSFPHPDTSRTCLLLPSLPLSLSPFTFHVCVFPTPIYPSFNLFCCLSVFHGYEAMSIRQSTSWQTHGRSAPLHT